LNEKAAVKQGQMSSKSSNLPSCFGTGAPDKENSCKICEWAAPCATVTRKFLPKDELREDVKDALATLKGEKH
jgi:hypothetical protein